MSHNLALEGADYSKLERHSTDVKEIVRLTHECYDNDTDWGFALDYPAQMYAKNADFANQHPTTRGGSTGEVLALARRANAHYDPDDLLPNSGSPASNDHGPAHPGG